MTRHEVNYNALATEQRNPFVVQQMPPDEGETEDDVVTDTDNEDTPRDTGLMIHVVPDTSKGMWCVLVCVCIGSATDSHTHLICNMHRSVPISRHSTGHFAAEIVVR